MGVIPSPNGITDELFLKSYDVCSSSLSTSTFHVRADPGLNTMRLRVYC